MKALFTNKFVLAALVLLALGAQFGLASLSHPVALAAGRQPQPPGRAPVTAAIRACPSPGSPGGVKAKGAVAGAVVGCFPDLYEALSGNPPDHVITI